MYGSDPITSEEVGCLSMSPNELIGLVGAG